MNLKAIPAKPWFSVFAQLDLKKVTFKILDGTTVTPNEIEIKIGTGNLTYTETKNIEYNLDRGALSGGTIREGDEVPMDVTFDFVWEYITSRLLSGQEPTISDALKQTGRAASWLSTDSDPCQPYSVDIQMEYDPACNDTDIETITFPDFRYESLAHDASAGTIACSGKCNAVQPIVVRSAGS